MNRNNETETRYIEPPKSVGGYDWGHVIVAVTRKPNWFQRLMIRWCFGWKWIDNE